MILNSLVCCSILSIGLVQKILIGNHLFVHLQFLIFFRFFFLQFLNSKLGYLMNSMIIKFFGLLQYPQHKACVKKLYWQHLFIWSKCMLKFKKTSISWHFLGFFSFFCTQNIGLWWGVWLLNSLFCCSIPST